MSAAHNAETPRDRAKRLKVEIEALPKSSYTKAEVAAVCSSIAGAPVIESEDMGCRAPETVTDLRRGDVFIAKLVGGKVRPWIVLSVDVDADIVTAVSMSSGDSAPGMVESQCRFWPRSFIGTTVSLFRQQQARSEVTRPYTNLRHLADVEASIAALYGMRVSPRVPRAVASVADIRARVAQDGAA